MNREQGSVNREVDSQIGGHLWTITDDRGICELAIELHWTLTDVNGRRTRGLQTRLRASRIQAPQAVGTDLERILY
jgi:hypothetical protein